MSKWASLSDVLDLCEKINMDDIVIEGLKEVFEKNDLDKFESLGRELIKTDTASKAAEQLSKEIDSENKIIELAVHLSAAVLSWDYVYKSKGMSKDVYYASMGAFSRFMKERTRYYNDINYDRGFWAWRFLCGLEFRIGELEYEVCKFNYENINKISKDSEVLSLHIPSDAVLTEEKLYDSYCEAFNFFEKYFSDFRYECVYTDTWLLSSKLKKLLKQNSKILNFMKDYEIVEEYPNRDDAIEWVFGRRDIQIDKLKENTSLQREVKRLLVNEEQVGTSLGILSYNGDTFNSNFNPFRIG
ncbi:MAG: acyltransferase domain-containing protein [Peptostreptococcaceae bacterium]